MSMKEIDLFIDESGNPGRGRGRYFTIACVAVDSINTKRVQRKMKKETLKIKQNYPIELPQLNLKLRFLTV